MGIINNRFISAFLDAFPSPKKKVFEVAAAGDAGLCKTSFGVEESGLLVSQGNSLDLVRSNVQPIREVAQNNTTHGTVSALEVIDKVQQREEFNEAQKLSDRNCPGVQSNIKQDDSGSTVECDTDHLRCISRKDSANSGAVQWERVVVGLRKFYGDRIYKSWLRFLSFDRVESGQVFLFTPTGFIREWIMVNYADNILEFFRSEDPSVTSIEVSVRGDSNREAWPPKEGVAMPSVKVNTDERKICFARESLTDDLSSTIDRNRTFDSFVVGKSNELAFTASKRVAKAAELPIPGSNPLFLYGGVGLGKTHLMHAIAWHIKENYENRRVIYLSAEKFMHKYITALKNRDMMSFKQIFRSVDVLMVDDVQFISGKESTQEEFFHTFNALIEQNKQLVISADRSPSDLQGVEERIQSRLSWGLVADINQTTFELRVGILESKLEQMRSNIVVPKKVVEFMARSIVSNVRELEGALNKVIAHSEITGSVITVESAKDLLADILRTNSIAVVLEDVIAKVSEYFSVKVSDLKSQRRVKNIAYARQICMFLSKSLTQRSLIDIGKFLGGRDHATVIHSVRKIEILMKNDAQVAEDVRILTKRLT